MRPFHPPGPPLPQRPPLDEERLRTIQTERSSPAYVARRTLGLLQTVHELLPQGLETPASRSPAPGLDTLSIICRALEAALSLHDFITASDRTLKGLEESRGLCSVLLERCQLLTREHGAEQRAAAVEAETGLRRAREILEEVASEHHSSAEQSIAPRPLAARGPAPSLFVLRRVIRALAQVLPSDHRDDWLEERISDLHSLPGRRRLLYVMQMARAAPLQAAHIRRNGRTAA